MATTSFLPLAELERTIRRHSLSADASELKAQSYAASADDYDRWGLAEDAELRRSVARRLRVEALIERVHAETIGEELARRAAG